MSNLVNKSLSTVDRSEQPYSIFDQRQKAILVTLVSVAATFSGFASNIYFPALPAIAKDLGVSIELVNLTITSYLIFQGLAPSLWGPISDVKGRRVAYTGTFLVLLAACLGLAKTKNYATLLALRCLQSTGSASTIAIGAGVIGDITVPEERGGFMGIFQAGLLVPFAIGPMIGGALAGALGWRSVFWFLGIYAAITLVCLWLLLPETLRSLVDNGRLLPSNRLLRFPLTVYQRTSKETWPQNSEDTRPPTKGIDLTGPFRILVSPQAAPILFYLAIYYAVWQMSITAMSTLFGEMYHLSEAQIGLTFAANGSGAMLGTFVSGRLLDKDYQRVKAKYERRRSSTNSEATTETPLLSRDSDRFPLEEARLRLVPIFAIIQCATILVFGWTINYSVHIAVPIITTFITGWTTVSSQSITYTYLVDVYTDRSAAASASVNLARCLMGAGGTSVVKPIMNRVGVGWAFTICVLVQAVALSGVAIQMKFGAKFRAADARNRAE